MNDVRSPSRNEFAPAGDVSVGDVQPAPIVPRSFSQYVRSFGTGLIMALTWLGATDIVNASVAGAEYGYALMWALALSFLARFAFVSIISKYELCNERGETLMAGMLRVHKSAPAVLLIMVWLITHLYGGYLVRGLGETSYEIMFRLGEPWMWSVAWQIAIFLIVFSGAFKSIEWIFLFFLIILSISFIGIAVWVGPSPVGIIKGVFLFEVPANSGGFNPLVVIVALVGSTVGSVTNLLYPYFIQQKGWKGPHYRRVQTYDLLFAVIVVIVLNLAVWVAAAEVLHPEGGQIHSLEDLANLFVIVMGPYGASLFNAGVLAAIVTTNIGAAMGFGYLTQDAVLKLTKGPEAVLRSAELRTSWGYRCYVIWFLATPFVWLFPGMPGFISMAVVVNAGSVVTIPILAGLLWRLTANPRLIGEKYKNGAWENLTMGVLFLLAVYGAWQSMVSLLAPGLSQP